MIPMAKEVAELIGEHAEQVENRSLLYEKFSLPKFWIDGFERKEAGRWSVLRICSRGNELLRQDAAQYRRRAQGRNVSPQNAGQWEQQAAWLEKLSRVALLDQLAAANAAKNKQFMAELSRSYGVGAATFEAVLGGRLLANMAGGVVENAGICLDRLFGLPLLPGSAVKGIARSQALWEIRGARQEQKERLLRSALLIFGYGANDLAARGDFGWAAGDLRLAQELARGLGAEDSKGCVTFLPGLPVSKPTLVVDMVNSHNPAYYSGRKDRATDDENPIPNYFPAVEKGALFAFGLVVSRTAGAVSSGELLQQAQTWIQTALQEKGAGAKTAAGYGWFQSGPVQPERDTMPGAEHGMAPAPAAPQSAADQLVTQWQGKLKTKDNFPAALPAMARLESLDDLRRVFAAVVPENERARMRKGNPYWQSFTSGKHEKDGKKILERLGLKLS